MKRKTTLVHAVCKNCETHLQGRYCHVCGQDVFSGAIRTVKDLTFNAVENMFVLDNKLFSTLKYLIFFPGKLSVEYRNGRVKRFVHPSKLFWFISIIFFTLLTVQIKNLISEDEKPNIEMTRILRPEVKKTKRVNEKNKTKIATASKQDIKNTVTESLKATDDSLVNLNIGEDMKEKEKRDMLISYFSTYSPYVSFTMIPFFALLLSLFFRKREYFYADHLAFALHFHSFIFILFGIHMAIASYFSISKFSAATFLIIPTIYLVISLYVFYRPKKFTLLPKIIGLSALYLITAFIIMILFLVLFAANAGFIDGSDF